MRVVEYARINRAWQQVREYYWFAPEPTEIFDNLRPPRRPCVGCARLFSAVNLRSHACLGGEPAYPRLPNARNLAEFTSDTNLMREYIATRGHLTVSTTENG